MKTYQSVIGTSCYMLFSLGHAYQLSATTHNFRLF